MHVGRRHGSRVQWRAEDIHATQIFAIAAVAALATLVPARADAQCCDHAKASCCTEATANCCDKDIDVLGQVPVDMTLSPATPVRQLTEVWFQRPTRVGKSILQGRYVIEHDNDRMARGERRPADGAPRRRAR